MYFVRSRNVCEMYDFALGGGAEAGENQYILRKLFLLNW